MGFIYAHLSFSFYWKEDPFLLCCFMEEFLSRWENGGHEQVWFLLLSLILRVISWHFCFVTCNVDNGPYTNYLESWRLSVLQKLRIFFFKVQCFIMYNRVCWCLIWFSVVYWKYQETDRPNKAFLLHIPWRRKHSEDDSSSCLPEEPKQSKTAL